MNNATPDQLQAALLALNDDTADVAPPEVAVGLLEFFASHDDTRRLAATWLRDQLLASFAPQPLLPFPPFLVREQRQKPA
jgi:hypothetical protein